MSFTRAVSRQSVPSSAPNCCLRSASFCVKTDGTRVTVTLLVQPEGGVTAEAESNGSFVTVTAELVPSAVSGTQQVA